MAADAKMTASWHSWPMQSQESAVLELFQVVFTSFSAVFTLFGGFLGGKRREIGLRRLESGQMFTCQEPWRR